MSVVVVTGSAGLVGSETADLFASLGFDVVGIDNDMRRTFFGEEASEGIYEKNLDRWQTESRARVTVALPQAGASN